MRIVAGEFGGRRLEVPKGRDIRPTGDKIRGAIFNALQSLIDLEECVVLDAFCGTGALGLEAISRGAKGCTFVDQSNGSLNLAKKNAQILGCLEKSDFIFGDASKARFSEPVFDLCVSKYGVIFCDPPYRKGLVSAFFSNSSVYNVVDDEVIFVLESEKDASYDLPDGASILKQKIYGDTAIVFVTYKKSVV